MKRWVKKWHLCQIDGVWWPSTSFLRYGGKKVAWEVAALKTDT